MIRIPSFLRGISVTLALAAPTLAQTSWQPTPAQGYVEGTGAYSSQVGGLPTSSNGGSYTVGDPSNLEGYSSSAFAVREPSAKFLLDALLMTRDNADDSPLLFDTVTNEELLSTGDLDAGTEPGVRASLIFFDGNGGNDLEFTFLGIDEFGTAIDRESVNPIAFPFFGGVPANPQTSYTVKYFSELNSGEVNLRRQLSDRVTLLGGFRFLELNERFNIDSDGGRFASDTDNDLFGVQIGGDFHLASIRRSVLFATVKSGLYYNNIDVNALAQLPAGGLIQFIDDEDEIAFVGEISLGLLIPMGPQADLRIGYQGLFLDGVALAPDQSNSYSLFTASGTADTSTLMYHGGFIGFDLFF